MLHLLTEVSVFVSLPNQCLCQVTGEPLIHVVPPNSGIMFQKQEAQEVHAQTNPATKRKMSGRHQDERPTKRLRTYESVSSVTTTGGTGTVTVQPTIKCVSNALHTVALFIPAQSRACRYLLNSSATFLCSPSTCSSPESYHSWTTTEACVFRYASYSSGPKTDFLLDILNLLNRSYHRRPKLCPEDYVEPDARAQAEQARHLAKYVFARQYGLSNVFDLSARSKGSMKVPDFVDREHEIQVPIPLSCQCMALIIFLGHLL